MERLTRKKLGNTDGKKLVLCNHREKDCDDSCQYGTCEWGRKALLRLKEYEDTGITPERIREMDKLYAEKCRELAELRRQKWIPVTERLPDTDDYILVSFENYATPDIARYEKDEDGGAFYPGDKEKSYVQYGLFVNAWMPLPEPYKETKDDE